MEQDCLENLTVSQPLKKPTAFSETPRGFTTSRRSHL